MKFKTQANFSTGRLTKLNNPEFTIDNNDKYLEFFINVKDKTDEYSLNFKTKVSLEELLNFKIGEQINFLNFLDEGDIIFGKNGIFDLNADIELKITRYVPNSFILDINLKDNENFFAYIELMFSIEK